MDPLSVASGVAGLITLAEVVISRTYNIIIACKHASEDSRKLLREVQALAGILQSVRTLETKLGNQSLQSRIPAAQVLACQQTLQLIRDKLDKADPKEPGLSRIQKTMRTLKWPISASDTEKFLSEMERHKSTFDLALSVDALDAILASQESEEKIASKIDEIGHYVEKLWKSEQTKETQRMLQMIGAHRADGPYHTNLKLHQRGTGIWFLEEGKPFHKWLATSGSKLWVYGIPGAGKTILSALAIGEVARTASTTHGVMFYYCSHREENSRHLSGILRCFVGQLARQNGDCMHLLQEKAAHHEGMTTQSWMNDEDGLISLLRKMVRLFGDVSVIVDGLDECHDSAAITDKLAKLASDVPHLRVLLFSRKQPEMEPFLEKFEQLSIAAESQDLRLYVPAQIEERVRLRKLRIRNPDTKDEIVEKLVNGADGMFRWVACQLDHLCGLTNDGELLAALKKLPRSLEETYDCILERVNGRSESASALVGNTLSWVFAGVGYPQLKANQLCEAVSIKPNSDSLDPNNVIDIEEILFHCSSLIRFDTIRSKFESAHFTVLEYLQTIDPVKKPHLQKYRLDRAHANAYMAEVCLTALNFESMSVENRSLERVKMQRQQFPFYFYAVEAWSDHMGYANAPPSETLQRLTHQLFCSPRRSNFANWRNALVLRRVLEENGVDDIEEEPDDLFTQLSCWATTLGYGSESSELHFAAMCHQTHLFTSLVESGLSINNHGIFGTPLHCALGGLDIIDAGKCHIDEFIWTSDRQRHVMKMCTAVKSLIALGADTGINYNERNTTIRYSPAQLACLLSEFSVLNQVLATGLKLDAAAAVLILEHNTDSGLDLSELEVLGDIDMDKIAECDKQAVGKLMSRYEASLMSSNPELLMGATEFMDSHQNLLPAYEEVLRDACEFDELDIIRCVFEKSDMPVDCKIGGHTALHLACSASSSETINYLVEKGADVNHRGTSGRIPLGALLQTQYSLGEEVLRALNTLLAANSEVLDVDAHQNSGLMLLARSAHRVRDLSEDALQTALSVLASNGTHLGHRNDKEQCVWHILAKNDDGHELAQLLRQQVTEEALERSIDSSDRDGRTALCVATSKGNVGMVDFFIESGSDPAARATDGRSVLHVAAGALNISPKPLQAVISTYRRCKANDTAEFAAALEYGMDCLCDNHDWTSNDMPNDQLRALLSLSSAAPMTRVFDRGDSGCMAMLARELAKYCQHNLLTCRACAGRLECFLILLHGPDDSRSHGVDHITCFELLVDGLRGHLSSRRKAKEKKKPPVLPEDTACIKALRQILEHHMHIGDPDCRSAILSAFKVAVQLRHATLIQAFLDAGLDVDSGSLNKQQMTPIEYLFYHAAPESNIKSAIALTKRLHERSHFGGGLLHLTTQSHAGGPGVLATRLAIIRALVDAGVDLNARSEDGGKTALMISAEEGNPTMVKLLLESGAETGVRTMDDENALTFAAWSGCDDSIALLLDYDCPVVYCWFTTAPGDFRSERRLYLGPLQLASHVFLQRPLITLSRLKTADKTNEKSTSVTALWMACAYSCIDNMEALLALDVDVDFQDSVDGMSPLHVAASMGCIEQVQALLGAGASPWSHDFSNLTARDHALAGRHQDVAEALLQATRSGAIRTNQTLARKQHSRKFRLEEKIMDPVYALIEEGDLEALKRLSSQGLCMALRFQSCNCTPMVVALAAGQVAIVTYFQDLGIHVSGELCPELGDSDCSAENLLASQPSMINALRRFVDTLPVGLTSTWNQMIHSAAAAENVGALRSLLGSGTDFNGWHRFKNPPIHVYNSGWRWRFQTRGSALHTAVTAGKYRSVDILLKAGFDPNELDLDGNAAAHIAAQKNFVRILDLLLGHGGAIEVRDMYMATPLITAAKAGRVASVDLLVGSGADIRAVDAHGDNALTVAAANSHLTLCSKFLKIGMRASALDVANMFVDGYKAVVMFDDVIRSVVDDPALLTVLSTIVSFLCAFLKLVPRHLRKQYLAIRFSEHNATILYRLAYQGLPSECKVLCEAGAMLNQEGGLEGTPLMVACKAGRLKMVIFFVRNGAALMYHKHDQLVSAFAKAKTHPKILRWLLVDRFTDQRKIACISIQDEGNKGSHDTGTMTVEINEERGPVELVLEDDVERYLESQNWFLPMRRFVDRADGAFDEQPLDSSEFWKFRPTTYPSKLSSPV
ncbi:hypothetical protein Q7P37_005581 [Cladosporium fusiforme]